MNSHRVLAWLSGAFLFLGILGATLHTLESYSTSAPVLSITFLVLGTAGVAFLAYLRQRD